MSSADGARASSGIRTLTSSYNFKGGFTNLRSGYQESAPFEMPVVYPTSSGYGVVSADNSFYTQGWVVVGPLTYFIKYDDHTIHAFASADLAKATLGSNIAALCLESVAKGSEPGQCAATFPRQSGPSYLYATGDGGADSGYVSVNANTGKLTWARSQVGSSSSLLYGPAYPSPPPLRQPSTRLSLALTSRKSYLSRSAMPPSLSTRLQVLCKYLAILKLHLTTTLTTTDRRSADRQTRPRIQHPCSPSPNLEQVLSSLPQASASIRTQLVSSS